ncbi:MAG: cytoplasmic protein, partial [Methyloligellaceae bacterium]
IFNSGFVRINSDTQDELFIWPYFAEFKPDELTPTQWVELYRLVPYTAVEGMKKKGKYTDYRAGIDRNGIWHFFIKGD